MGFLKVRIARPMVARHCRRRIAVLIICDSINKRTGMQVLAAQDGLPVAQVDYSESGRRQDLDSGALQRVSATGQVRRTRTFKLRILKFRFGSI